MKKILKSEKREELARKQIIKKKKGGTLAGQMTKFVLNKKYQGRKIKQSK